MGVGAHDSLAINAVLCYYINIRLSVSYRNITREGLFMVTEDLVQEISTLSPSQQESVYSFVYLLKHPERMRISEQESIEPFASEREALDFVNDYAARMLYETR
jgi:hypothetical protein